MVSRLLLGSRADSCFSGDGNTGGETGSWGGGYVQYGTVTVAFEGPLGYNRQCAS